MSNQQGGDVPHRLVLEEDSATWKDDSLLLLQFRSNSEPVASANPSNRRVNQVFSQHMPLNKAAEFWNYLAGELLSYLHGSCPKCHHWHNHVEFRFIPGIHNKVMCQKCEHVIFGLGGDGSHESLMSQNTLPKVSHHHRPCSNGCTQHAPATLTIAPKKTGLSPVHESETDGLPISRSAVPQDLENENTTELKLEESQAATLVARPSSTFLKQKISPLRATDNKEPVKQRRKHARTFSTFKGRFKQWKSKWPLEFRFPVAWKHRRSCRRASDLRIHGSKQTSTATDHEEVSPESPRSPVVTDYDLRTKEFCLRPDDQQPKPSNSTTLNGTPNPSRPRSTADRGKGRTEQSHREPPGDDDKAKRRADMRQALTNEADANRCKCTSECHCLQQFDNAHRATSPPLQPLSDFGGQYTESDMYLDPLSAHEDALSSYYMRYIGSGTNPERGTPGDSLAETGSQPSDISRSVYAAARYHYDSGESSLGNPYHRPQEIDEGAIREEPQPRQNNNRFTASEPPPLSDSSTTMFSSRRSETSSDCQPEVFYLDQNVMSQLQIEPETLPGGDGDRTPTQETLL